MHDEDNMIIFYTGLIAYGIYGLLKSRQEKEKRKPMNQ